MMFNIWMIKNELIRLTLLSQQLVTRTWWTGTTWIRWRTAASSVTWATPTLRSTCWAWRRRTWLGRRSGARWTTSSGRGGSGWCCWPKVGGSTYPVPRFPASSSLLQQLLRSVHAFMSHQHQRASFISTNICYATFEMWSKNISMHITGI